MIISTCNVVHQGNGTGLGRGLEAVSSHGHCVQAHCKGDAIILRRHSGHPELPAYGLRSPRHCSCSLWKALPLRDLDYRNVRLQRHRVKNIHTESKEPKGAPIIGTVHLEIMMHNAAHRVSRGVSGLCLRCVLEQ